MGKKAGAARSGWAPFRNSGRAAADAFEYEGAALRKAWARLHCGDAEPFPSGRSGTALQSAWRDFHAGRFQAACDAGDALGPPGAAVANKAAGVYATYLARGDAEALAILQAAIERGTRAVADRPDDPNAHYFHAFVLGRYSQRISVVRALAEGLAGQVRKSLERTLALEPKHAEAHVASGVFQAEVLDKLGSIAARLSYGATRDGVSQHFDTALHLAPQSPIVYLEYARALTLLEPADRKRPRERLEAASAIEPADAMEALDVAAAKALLRAR